MPKACRRISLALVLVAASVMLGPPSHSQEVPMYHPPGMWTWDYWFAVDGDTYHAFYLQAPMCLPDPALKHGHQHVGHAVSHDLVNWDDLGPALVPVHGTWNDLSIATGSVARHDGNWWMLFSGRGSKASGMGLAVSEDLVHWSKVGDGPVVPFGAQFKGEWEGRELTWFPLADPYVYPEPFDGWFYAVINARVVGEPIETSGCLAAMRSRDFSSWEPAGIWAFPKWFERMETPQVWTRDGKWYLYFGAHGGLQHDALREGAPEAYHKAGNFVFMADRMEGPYEPVGQWWLNLPDGRSGYIYKVVEGPAGDVLLTSIDCKLSSPYRVTYAGDGSMKLSVPSPNTP